MNSVQITTPHDALETTVLQGDGELGAQAAFQFIARRLAWERRLTELHAEADGQPTAEVRRADHAVRGGLLGDEPTIATGGWSNQDNQIVADRIGRSTEDLADVCSRVLWADGAPTVEGADACIAREDIYSGSGC